MSDRYDDHGPFDADELVSWATSYGHPEGWAKKAQDLHGKCEALQKNRDAYQARLAEAVAENERLRAALAKIADKAKYLSEPAWNLEGCTLVGQQIYRWAADGLEDHGA